LVGRDDPAGIRHASIDHLRPADEAIERPTITAD
jgi:hypothetical protein